MDETYFRSSRIGALAALALACLLWGVSFPLMQFAMHAFGRVAADHAPAIGDVAQRATLNAWRFLAACVLYLLLIHRRLRAVSSCDLRGGLSVGVFFSLALMLQLAGLRYCLPSVSGVLTSIVVVFTPFALFLVFRRRVSGIVWLSSFIALFGVVILSQPNPDAATVRTLAEVPPFPWLGEILTGLAAVLFTAQLLALDHYGRGADSLRLSLIMFAATAAVSAVLSLGFGGARLWNVSLFNALGHDAIFLGSFAALVILSSVIAFHLMNVFQPRISASAAAIVYCLEPVFATMWSVLFGTERLTGITCIGGGLVIVAVLIISVWSGNGEVRKR